MTVRRKRIRDASTGTFTTVLEIEMQSPTFGRDLAYVFNRNIKNARRENKRIIGVEDVEP